MSEEAQERFEDYLELEQYIELLRLQKSAHLPANLAPQQTGIYGMALLFHTASPQVADPRPEFKEQLRQRLLEQLRADEQTPEQKGQETVEQRGANPAPTVPPQEQRQFRNLYSHKQVPPPVQPPSPHPKSGDAKQYKRRRVSRRTLFWGGTIAASLLAGAGVGASVEHSLQPQPNLHPTIRGDTWHLVASLKELGKEPIRFTTDSITGYVIRHVANGKESVEGKEGASPTSTEQVIAFSAACTHLGCIVQWQEDKRQFPCPCHGRTFDTSGDPVYTDNSQPHYTSLPHLETKIEKGNIYVKVPVL